MQLGIISDTHGLVRPSLLEVLHGVDAILHAGDVGDPQVLEMLSEVAPVHAVRGNVDGPELPETLELEFSGWRFAIAHGHLVASPGRERALTRLFAQADFIVYGHTHEARLEVHGAQLVLNPGSCGSKRFSLPVTAGILELRATGYAWTFCTLG